MREVEWEGGGIGMKGVGGGEGEGEQVNGWMSRPRFQKSSSLGSNLLLYHWEWYRSLPAKSLRSLEEKNLSFCFFNLKRKVLETLHKLHLKSTPQIYATLLQIYTWRIRWLSTFPRTIKIHAESFWHLLTLTRTLQNTWNHLTGFQTWKGRERVQATTSSYT